MYFDDPSDAILQSDDAKYLKRKIKGGNIDVHPSEKAIVVNYEVEATILGELGDPMLGEKKVSQKVIRLSSLNDSTDITALAKEVVEKCKLIHVSKLPEVEQLLYYLQNRKETAKTSTLEKGGKLKKQFNGLQDPAPDFLKDPSISNREAPSISNIDEYVEQLYEDISEKIQGSAMLLNLARNPDNLEELHLHETVLGALTRVLREDSKKSVELSTNIMYIFFCFSSYTQFHSVIAKYKIGALCMTIVEHELQRHDAWKEELVKHKSKTAGNEAMAKENEKSSRKLVGLMHKQDQLFRVAFYLLLNLSEDTRVEIKMKNKKIVNMLVKTLETRRNPDLILLVISFLKKLSIFAENKNEMVKQRVVEKLVPFLTSGNEELKSLIFRLLLNLSFDVSIRQQIVDNGLLPKIASNFGNEVNQTVVICLLYHLSIDDKTRTLFSYTDCIPQLLELIFSFPPGPVSVEVAALGINLATKEKNTEIICNLDGGKALKYLVKRAFKFKDCMLFKMLRNMSQHSGATRNKFIEFAGLYAKALRSDYDEDLVIECLGTLANLQHEDIDYGIILSKYDLLPYIQEVLVPGHAEDDLVLECVVLLGTIAFDSSCAALLATSGVIPILIELLNAKQEDDELVLQIAYVFHQMVWHEETRNVIISETQVPAYLIDLMHDRNSEIRSICDNTLDIIMEFDAVLAKRIKLEKFRWHNSQWVEMIESQHDVAADHDDLYDDDVLSPYLQEGNLLYEPNFDDNMLMDNVAIKPEYIDEEVLRQGLESGQIIPSGYLTNYADPSDDPRFMMQQVAGASEYYEPHSFARPSSPDYPAYY